MMTTGKLSSNTEMGSVLRTAIQKMPFDKYVLDGFFVATDKMKEQLIYEQPPDPIDPTKVIRGVTTQVGKQIERPAKPTGSGATKPGSAGAGTGSTAAATPDFQ